jgi:hypothetical protein
VLPNSISDNFLPFARPDYVEGMLIGDDLDSLLSAAYLQQHFGWPIDGIYCQYTHLWHTAPWPVFREKLLSGRLVAVDLDICHPCVPNIGHHIVALNAGTPPAAHSLNPNTLLGRTAAQNFKQKYPLATIHLLRWLLETERPVAWRREAELLTWLADSAFVNAQHYRANVKDWVTQHLPLPAFLAWLPTLQTLDFELELRDNVLKPLLACPLARPGARARTYSRHLGLSGFQCQWQHPARQQPELEQLTHLLADLSGWQRLLLPRHWAGVRSGVRHETGVAALPNDFADWLSREAVFSCAFTFRDRLNYTTGLPG